ncbi:MAG TPA: hypothetical protein VGK94_10680 [Candidatus Polarisedimenticolia bacterium]|jgi:hypothetical protein
MQRGAPAKLGLIPILTAVFILLPAREVAGFGTTHATPPRVEVAPAGPEVRLAEGFRQILSFFGARDFSLLAAWREMRASGDPAFFERKYPAISRELDAWAASLEDRYGGPESSDADLDFTFLLHEFAPVILDPSASGVARDNALATVSMVCLMDGLRCEPAALHGLLGAVILQDPSALRRAEALRWWRRSGDPIDESLLEKVLSPGAGADLEVRSEASRILFSMEPERSLRAQRLLISTVGLPPDPTGELSRIACEAIQRLSTAQFPEAVPDLIRALTDPSQQVRACAADSLSLLTGRDFGFEADDDGPANREAIARWRAWWKDHGSSGTDVMR